VTELRALNVVERTYRSPHVVSGYFDDIERLAAAACEIEQASGIYVIPNPVRPALLARASNRTRPITRDPLTGDTDVAHRHWLLIDLDPQRPAGISATDDEHSAALQCAREIRTALREHGWPEPVLADSGNGAHLLYRIDLPTNDGGLVKRVLAALAFRFDDASVKVDLTTHNPARIWKLYGTPARKGDHLPGTTNTPVHSGTRWRGEDHAIDGIDAITGAFRREIRYAIFNNPWSEADAAWQLDNHIADIAQGFIRSLGYSSPRLLATQLCCTRS
jgi:hypothetical protein